MEFEPTVGQIVHFQKVVDVEWMPEPCAAIITKVLDKEKGLCSLFVLLPTNCIFTEAEYSAEPKAGYWNWPPKIN